MGCVIQAGLGQNVARQASIKAGLPIETPAVTVNVVCGSGLELCKYGSSDDSRQEMLTSLLQVVWKICLWHHML